MLEHERLGVFSVVADCQSGMWLDDPYYTMQDVSPKEWARMVDTDDVHYDTYEQLVQGESDDYPEEETRAIIVLWEYPEPIQETVARLRDIDERVARVLVRIDAQLS